MQAKARIAIALIIITALGIAAYATSLSNKFVWDDKHLVENNQRIRSFANIPQVFKEDLFHSGESPTGYYRPGQVVSYMVDYALWGRKPFGYHLTSVAIQILNSGLVYYLLLLVTGSFGISLFTACVFCVHPAFVPVTGYISGRADLLAFFFSVLSIYLGIKNIKEGASLIRLAAALICYSLAVLSKEFYMIAPLFILLYIFTAAADGKKRPFKDMALVLAMFLIAAAYLALRQTTLNFHQKMGVIADMPLSARLWLAPYILTSYIGTLLLPVNIFMEKKLVYSSLNEARFVLSWAVPAALAWLGYYLYKVKEKKGLFLLGWFLLGLIFVCHIIIPLKAFMADHWTYLAAPGFFGLIALSAWRLAGKSPGAGARKVFWALSAVIIIIFTALTIKENGYWKDEETFFSRTLSRSPDSVRTQFNMAKVYEEKREYDKALGIYTKLIDDSPGKNAYVYNGRAMLYKKMGNIDKALADCEMAVNIEPVSMYLNNLGGIYVEMGDEYKGAAKFKEALKADPNNELAKKNLKLISGE